MSLKMHSVLREWHMASSLSELDTDFLAYIFQNQNMELTTSQRYRWNGLSGKALTTQELRLSLFPWLCFLSCMCLGIETSWGKRLPDACCGAYSFIASALLRHISYEAFGYT